MLVTTIMEVSKHSTEMIPVLLDQSTDMELLAKVMDEEGVRIEDRAKVFVWCAINKPQDLPKMLKHGNVRTLLSAMRYYIPAPILERFGIMEKMLHARGIDSLVFPANTLMIGTDSEMCALVNPTSYIGASWYFSSTRYESDGEACYDKTFAELKDTTLKSPKVYGCIAIKAPQTNKLKVHNEEGDAVAGCTPKGFSVVTSLSGGDYSKEYILYQSKTQAKLYCVGIYKRTGYPTKGISSKKFLYMTAPIVVRSHTLPSFIAQAQTAFNNAPAASGAEGGVEAVPVVEKPATEA